MKFFFTVLMALLVFKNMGVAQDSSAKVPRIAVFSPLYLDSSFGLKGYKYGKLVPPFAIQGVEYMFGALKAIDSLKKENKPVHYFIYDSKSSYKNIPSLIANGTLDSMDMLIGSVLGADVKLLADFALQKKIPFISATFPNDAGVNNNPNFLILNSTLKTNCKGLHEFIGNKFADQRIVFLTRSGKQEERITNYFKEFEKNSTKPSLAITYANLENDFSDANIEKWLDSTLLTTYIIGSTDVTFAKTIAKNIIKNKQQEQSNLIGLPTWDDATEFAKKDYAGIHFYYVTPMVTPKTALATQLNDKFKARYGTKAGDNMYRGFSSLYTFSKLLLKYQHNLSGNFADKSFTVFEPCNIQPVMLDPANMTLDYFENKKVCLMKRFNGETSQIMQ